MKSSSGSIQRKLQWGFSLGVTVLMALGAGCLQVALHRHQRNAAAERTARHGRSLQEALSQRALQPWGGPDSVETAWVALGAAGEIRLQNSRARELPMDLAWPAPQAEPLTQRVGDRMFTVVVLPWSAPEGRGLLRVALDHTEDLAFFDRLQVTLLVTVVGAGVLAGLFGRLLAKRSLAPLSRITRQTGSIDYRRLDVRLQEADFPEEFGLLVKTLNASLSRLQTSFDRLARLGAELAHELRTPLQNLRVGLEDLILRPRGLDATRDGIGGALEEVARLASLIDQVLLLARSEHPGAAISARELDLRSLLEAIAEPFCLTAEEKNVEIQVQVEDGLRLIADEVLVRRAANNLLANALRHAPEGGWIVVGAFMVGREVRIWVEDNGPGIPAGWVNKVGTPFERGPSMSGDGFGLGLAIVKGIMNLHGGQMVLESTVGHGTKVSLSFPKPGLN